MPLAMTPQAMASVLVEGGACAAMPDSRGLSPLMVASANGATPIVRMLLRQGGKGRSGLDVNGTDIGGHTALWLAVLNR